MRCRLATKAPYVPSYSWSTEGKVQENRRNCTGGKSKRNDAYYLEVSHTYIIKKKLSIHSYCTAASDCKNTQQWRIRTSSSGWFHWCRNQYNRLRGGSHIPGLPAVHAIPSIRLAAMAGAQRCRAASVFTLNCCEDMQLQGCRSALLTELGFGFFSLLAFRQPN